MIIVRTQKPDDNDKIKAISICNNSHSKVNANTIVIEDTSKNKILGYSKYSNNGSVIKVHEMCLAPGVLNPRYPTLLFNHIRKIEPETRSYEYSGKYAKQLEFKGGEYKLRMSTRNLKINEKLKTRKEKLDGVEYLVAPVVMVKEQVLNGEFLPAEEIEKSAVGWNGRPVVVYHPKDEGGRDTIANDPEVIPKYEVGRVYNAEYEPKTTKLKAEVWIDISRAKRKNKDTKMALSMIENSEHLEVSTGYVVNDRVEEEGTFDGIEFNAIQKDILPDHLALLPEEIGACSWDDGAGVRNNTSKVKSFLKRLVSNLTTKGSIQQQVMNALREEYDDFDWVSDLVHDDESGEDFAIFNTRAVFENDKVIEQGKMYAISYSFNDLGEVVLGDSLNEVEPVQQYKEKNKEGKALNKKETLVRDVIANSKGKLGRKDKTTLLNCNTAALIAMLPVEKRKAYKVNSKSSKTNSSFVTNAFKGRTFKTNEGEEMLVEELIAMEPTEVVETVEAITDVAELEAVAQVLEEVIQVAEVVEAVGTDLEANEEFTTMVEEVIASAEEVLAVVDEAISTMGGTDDSGNEEPAANVDVSDVFEPEEDLEEQLVSALETASSRRKRMRSNARGKETKQVAKKAPAKTMSINDYINSIPDQEAREFIKNGIAESKKHRSDLLATLTGNKNCAFSEKELKAMETNQLEKIANMIGSVSKHGHARNTSTDYSIRGLQVNEKENKGYVPMTKNIFKKDGGK